VTRLVLCVVVLLAVLVGGCGEEGSQEEGAGETTPAPRAAPPATPETTPAPRAASPAAPEAITEVNSGESFTLFAGSETRLRLSGEYVWSEPTARDDVVELTHVDYFQDPGFSEWAILAVQPGTATIAARGTPACAGQEQCPGAPLRFQVQITVVR
jgi:hypothetical protein